MVENRPPGAMVPEFQPEASEVEVCATESVLVHVTVVPATTSSWSGMNALLPSVSAPEGIDTVDHDPDTTGVDEDYGATGSDELLPQAVTNITSAAATRTRRNEGTSRPS